MQKVKSIRDKYLFWHRQIALFSERLSDIHSSSVMLTNSDVHRNNLSTMPEIKYAAVGKAFNKDKLMKFGVVDTETTGLKANSGKIIQLSAIKYVDWEPVERWDTYLDPGNVKVDPGASKVNGLTNEMLTGKPTIKQVAHSFMDFIGDSAVIGYNLPFDLKFLYAEGIDLTETKRKFFDVLTLARKYYKGELDSFSLMDVASLNYIYYNAHNSLHDCLATGEVFERIVDGITG